MAKLNKILTRQHSMVIPVARAVTAMFRVAADTAAAVNHAVSKLQAGCVIAVPTDTIYGLAASAQDDKAVRHLYVIKHRDEEKPVAICLSQVEHVSKWGETRHLPKGLLESLLPGPVTVVLNRSKHLNPSLNPGNPLVGIRVPDDPFIRTVVARFGKPVALTSANLSSEPSPLNPSEFSGLWPLLGAIFDGGTLPGCRSGSTVVNLSVPRAYKIVRDGSALEMTVNCLEKFGLVSTDN